ncbi:MAG TPA: ABC transporter ATP-binding protein [Candidatus Latescibacteria bacterium]|nr:ABC transporter ATP-binding protein [Candidatus Latescibacterota bacterium]HRS95320.1 ABC transporter ATP-binding protein [Candidatus Latescibacterota bacterium]
MASSQENTVRARAVRKRFPMGEGYLEALKGIDLEIKRGEYISIMGPSGSGKTTLFNMIGGLDKPSDGTVYIDEVDIAQLDAYELAWLRCRKIGYIFQTFNLIPVMTALENVTLPMIFAGLSNDEAISKGRGLLDTVGLGERWQHKPTELSGGQQQRVAIARSFANDPSIILADEPTANLDLKTGHDIIELLRKLNKEMGVTIISNTHDPSMLNVSDRIIWIRDGRVDRIEARSDIDINVGTIGGDVLGGVGSADSHGGAAGKHAMDRLTGEATNTGE